MPNLDDVNKLVAHSLGADPNTPLGKVIDCESTDSPVCPYCGIENYDEISDNKNNSYTETCCECGKVFAVEREFSVTYSTYKPNLCTRCGKHVQVTYLSCVEANVLSCLGCLNEVELKDLQSTGDIPCGVSVVRGTD